MFLLVALWCLLHCTHVDGRVQRPAAAMPRPNRCPNVTFIIHSHERMDNLTTFMEHTSMINVNVVVMTGQDFFVNEVSIEEKRRSRVRELHEAHRKLLKITYDGNPGTLGRSFKTGNARGSHRTMAGVLIANDTYPHSQWFHLLEHDNFVFVEHVCEVLGKIDHNIPLLLGEVGPHNAHPPCRETSDSSHWTCCTSLTAPCTVDLSATDGVQSNFIYDAGRQSMVPLPCAEVNHNGKVVGQLQPDECCQTVPWPSGMEHGFRYRIRHPYEDNDKRRHHAIQTPHSTIMYPRGGATYALSKGMLNAIGRHKWEKMTYALQCHQADVNIMVAVLNNGYSLTQFEQFGALHHVHDEAAVVQIALSPPPADKESSVAAVAARTLPQLVKDAICSYPPGKGNVRKYAAECARLCPTCDTESDVDEVKYFEAGQRPQTMDDRAGVWFYPGAVEGGPLQPGRRAQAGEVQEARTEAAGWREGAFSWLWR